MTSLSLILSLVSSLIRGVGTELFDDGTARRILFFAANLLNAYGDATDDLKVFVEQIQKLVDEDRAATPEEWAEWQARSQAASDRIRAAATGGGA